MIDTPRERVMRGAALLDRAHDDDWRSKITATFDIEDYKRCILGQLYGDFTSGKVTLGLDSDALKTHGFLAVAIDGDIVVESAQYNADVTGLNDAWQEALGA